MADQPPPSYQSVDTKSYPPPSPVYPQQQPPPQPYQGPVYQPDPSLPPGAYYTAGGLPGQQQSYVVAQAPQVVVIAAPPTQSYGVQIVLSCVVFWCCGCLCGLIAFILAIMAQSSSFSNPESARQLSRASFGVSIAGIVVGVVIILLTIVIDVLIPLLYVAGTASTVAGQDLWQQPCKYPVEDSCFGERVTSQNGFCANASHLYHENYCYFQER